MEKQTLLIDDLIATIRDLEGVYSEMYNRGNLVKREQNPKNMNISSRSLETLREENERLFSQIERETDLLSSSKICKSGDDNIIELLKNMGTKDIKKYMVSHVTDPNVLTAFKCVIDEILDVNESDGSEDREILMEMKSKISSLGFSEKTERTLLKFVSQAMNPKNRDIPDIKKKINAFNSKPDLTFDQVNFSHKLFEILLKLKTDESLTTRLKISDFMGKMKRIGADSANGVAMKVDVGNESLSISNVGVHPKENFGNVIVKVPRNSFNSSELVHEAIVGSELNKLRSKCPHFSAVFDTYFEGAPIDNSRGQIVQEAVAGEDIVSHAIYESVNNPCSISDAESRDQLLLMFTMMVSGFIIANQECDFTHYDAHDDNILLYDSEEPEKFIGYNIKGKNFWLKCIGGRFPMAIDYGMSHVVINENHYGVINPGGWFTSLTIYGDLSNYVSDPFKLICMIAKKIQYQLVDRRSLSKMSTEKRFKYKKNREECLDLCCRILGYFFESNTPKEHENGSSANDAAFGISRQNLDKILRQLWDERYHIPIQVVNKKKWSNEGLLNHCLNIIKTSVPDAYCESEPDEVLGKENKSNSVGQALIQLGAAKIDIVNSEDLFIARDSKEYEKIRERFLANISESLESDRNRIIHFLHYSWSGLYLMVPRNRNEITDVIKNILEDNTIKIASFVQEMSDMKNNLKILKYAKKIAPEYEELYQELKTKYESLYLYVSQHREATKISKNQLSMFVIGSLEEPNSQELEHAKNRETRQAVNLFSLYIKYKSVANSYLELSSA